MNRYLLFLLLFSRFFYGFSQKYIKPMAGVNFSQRILKSDYSKRKDSLDNSDNFHAFPMAGVHFLFEKKPGVEFYFGFNFTDNGFKRTRYNYQFLDTVHPELGQIFDLSQGAQKNAVFTYHFKYLETPLGFNFQITPRHKMNVFIGWLTLGIIPQFLLKQNLGIFLEGFSMNGQNKFTVSNTNYDAAKANCALQLGSRFDFNVKGKFWVNFEPTFRMPLKTNASNATETLRLWNASAIVGLRYEIGDFY